MQIKDDHDAIRESLGVYALDAVDATEAAAISRHVAHCEECHEELGRHLEVVSMLSATERFAPPLLWDGIADGIKGEPDAAPDQFVAAQVVPLAVRHRRWLRPATMAAAIALLIGAVTVQSVRYELAADDLTAAQAELAALEQQLERPPMDVAAEQALASSTGRRVILDSQIGGSSAIIVLMADGTGYLAEHSLQPLPPEQTYQLWAIVDGKVISAGVLGSNPGIVPFRIDPNGFEGFAITEESVGGVVTSQNDPVVAWVEA